MLTEQFRVKPWLGTLCCFLGQDNVTLTVSLSPLRSILMGTVL